MTSPPQLCPQTYIPGGSFLMGSDHHYPEESPAQIVEVEPFWMDIYPVTNRRFAKFAHSTGYITTAETAEMASPPAGSLVFTMRSGPVDLSDFRNWWRWVPGADWQHPTGPDSDLEGLEDHPVVHISLTDAQAYAQWAERDLPTEAEWEFAARGGKDGAEFVWGDQDFQQTDSPRANTWQGRFPYENTDPHGWVRTSPVGFYPANHYGLYDMAGNVWEWTVDRYHHNPPNSACCSPDKDNNIGGSQVIKGGSHLCTIQYCFRYRPAARQPFSADSFSSHVGFRCLNRSTTPTLDNNEHL